MDFYRFYIKTLEKPVKFIFYICFFSVFAYLIIIILNVNVLINLHNLISALFTISVSVITGVIVYVLTTHKPAMDNTHRTLGEVITHFDLLKGNLVSILNFTFGKSITEYHLNEKFWEYILQEMDQYAEENPEIILEFAEWGAKFKDRICYHVDYIKRTSLADQYIFALLKQIENTISTLQKWYDNITGLKNFNQLVPLSVIPSDIGVICQDIDSLIRHMKNVYEEK